MPPAKVTSVGFLISHQQAGPFNLEVAWIKASQTAGNWLYHIEEWRARALEAPAIAVLPWGRRGRLGSPSTATNRAAYHPVTGVQQGRIVPLATSSNFGDELRTRVAEQRRGRQLEMALLSAGSSIDCDDSDPSKKRRMKEKSCSPEDSYITRS